MILPALITFSFGTLFQASCVGWTHFSEKGKPFKTALFAMICAIAQISGIVDSIKDIRLAPFFVLGYGFGAYLAVYFKTKYLKEI